MTNNISFSQIDSAMVFLNKKRISKAFYKWKFKIEKKKFESKLKDHYNLKRCFRKWLKLKNKRRIINDLVNNKKNALVETFIKKSNTVDKILLNKIKQYFLGRLIKNINNEYACDLLQHLYINNYKKIFIQRLLRKPNLIKGGDILEKLLNELLKKKAIKTMSRKLKVTKFVKKMNDIYVKKIKEKFSDKFDELVKTNEEKEENNEASKLNKFGKKIKRIMNNNLKRYAFNKLKENIKDYKNMDKLIEGIKKIISKFFFEKLKNKLNKINSLKNVQNIIDKNKFSDLINKLKSIANSPEGIKNQKRINCNKLKNILERIINEKVRKRVFNEIKRKYNIINASNRLNKLMNDRYKKRLLYLINMIYIYNKPKTSKIKSRYPLSNMTDISTKIEKLLLKKFRKKFINELKNIKKIDKQFYYMFLTISHNIKKRVFDTLKIIYFIDLLNNENKTNQNNKKKFLDKLKNIYQKYLKEKNNKDIVNDAFNKWNELTNKEKIFNSLKNYIKLKKFFDLWKKSRDLNRIKNIFINMKKLKDKENNELLKEHLNKWKNYSDKNKIFNNLKNWKKGKNEQNNMLKKYLNKWNDKSIRKKILDELRKLSKLQNLFKILKEKEKKNIEKSFNNWKDKVRLLKEKENKIYIPKNIKLKRQNVESTIIKSEKPKRTEYVIIKENTISINDKNNKDNYRDNLFNKDKDKDEKSIKRKKKSKSKSKTKPKSILKSKSQSKIQKYQKDREILQDGFEKWRNVIKKMKSIDDLKDVLNSMKDYNNKNISEKEILNKLKKATLYLIFDIYKKNKNMILKKYFDRWAKNAKENNREKKESFASKYIKKKKGLFNKINEIRNNNNKARLRNYNPNEMTFTKRKTKINFYKDTFDLYNPSGEKLLSNINSIEDYRPITERSYNNNNNNLLTNGTSSTINYLFKKNNFEPNYLNKEKNVEIPKKIYTSRSMEKRKPKKLLNISIFGENDGNEYPNDSTENKNTYDSKLDTADKNYIDYLKYLDNTISSLNYSTNNHFSLIEESNEIRKPDDYNNRTMNKPIMKKNRIKDLLSSPFENINNTSFKNKLLLTERKSRNDRSKNFTNNDKDINYTSRSLKTRNRMKPKMFTVSIPISNNYDKDDNTDLEYNKIENLKAKLKYNDLKRNKEISPERGNSNYYSIDNTNAKTSRNNNINYSQYLSTPFKDFRIDWENDESTCPRILKDESNQDQIDEYGLNEYRRNDRDKRIKRHNKCKSGFEYKPELGRTYIDSRNRYNIGNNYIK